MIKRQRSSPAWGVLLILVLAALALAACEPGAPEVAAVEGGLTVWLDQPPNGANLPLAPFTLKAHASNPGGPGVSQINFLVNAVPVGTIATDETLPLAYAEVEWNPAAPGLYEIQAQAFNAEGWAFSDTAHVCVGGDCALALVAEAPTEEVTEEVTPTETLTPIPGVTPTHTPTPANTPIPTRTPTITNTPVCAMAVPELISPPNGGTVDTPNPSLTWNYVSRDCPVQGFRVDLSTDPGFADTSLSGGTGNPSTSWGPGQPLADCTTYYWRVAGIIGTTLGPFSGTWSFNTAFPGGCGAPLDDDPPSLSVQGPSEAYYGSYCAPQDKITSIYAFASDPSGVGSVRLDWRYRSLDGQRIGQWHAINMTPQGGDSYLGQIIHDNYSSEQRQILQGGYGQLEYVVTATDTLNNSTQQSFIIPIYVCIG